MTVTLYIPTLNSSHYIEQLFLNIEQWRHLLDEVLVIDGGSSDITVSVGRQFGARVVVNERQHIAAARRIAVQEAQGDILISIDSDCVPQNGWLPSMLKYFEDTEVIGVGGPYICPNPTTEIERFSARVFEGIMHFPKEVIQATMVGMPGTFVEGNCAFRREALLAIGNYRDIFTNHAEGVDIFWRLLREDCKLIFDPALAVEHLGYPKTLWEMLWRNYHYGWSSTKLAKYTLGKTRFDMSLYRQMCSSGFSTITDWGPRHRDHALTLFQLVAFIYGKAVSSVALLHPNF